MRVLDLFSGIGGFSLGRNLPAPFTCGGNDGIHFRMERTQALRNAVVPQIPQLIGRAIMASGGAAPRL